MIDENFIEAAKQLTDEEQIKKAFIDNNIDVEKEFPGIDDNTERELSGSELEDVVGGASVLDLFSAAKSKKKYSRAWLVLFLSYVEYKKNGKVISFDNTQIKRALTM